MAEPAQSTARRGRVKALPRRTSTPSCPSMHRHRFIDIGPPRYAGADNKRRAWQEVFGAYAGPIAYEVHELNVTTDGELAFVHSLDHVSGTLASGHISDLWLRWTACFRRIDGIWLVVHDHVSVPTDLSMAKLF